MQPTALTRIHRVLIGVVIAGAVVIAAIGFAGSYAAVRDLAAAKGFGSFAVFFPIGIDAGIVVALALDLLLTWIRIPFPLIRHTAWFLTAATIAFNGAAAWPDPLGVAMHATIPLLFITTVEAARHAIGRIADITADRHIEPVRLTRWLLAPTTTFRLWRRMKLWELRSYDQALALERERIVYRTRLRAAYGRRWRRKAPPEALLALKLTAYGLPLPPEYASGRADSESAANQPPPGPAAPAAPGRPVASGRRAAAEPAGNTDAGPRLQLPRPRPPHGQVNGHARPRPPQEPAVLAAEQAPARSRTAETDSGEPALSEAPSPPAPRPPAPAAGTGGAGAGKAADSTSDRTEIYYRAFCDLADAFQRFPEPEELSKHLFRAYRLTGRPGQPISPNTLRRIHPELAARYAEERDLPA